MIQNCCYEKSKNAAKPVKYCVDPFINFAIGALFFGTIALIISIFLAITKPLFVKALLKKLNLKNVKLEKGLFITGTTGIAALFGGVPSFIAFESFCFCVKKAINNKDVYDTSSTDYDYSGKTLNDATSFIETLFTLEPFDTNDNFKKDFFNKENSFDIKLANSHDIFEHIENLIIFDDLEVTKYLKNNVNGYNNIDDMELKENMIVENSDYDKNSCPYIWNNKKSDLEMIKGFKRIIETIENETIKDSVIEE